MPRARVLVAVTASVAAVVVLAAGCGAGPGSGRGGSVAVGCADLLAFLGTDAALPGEPVCRRSDGIDTHYEAVLTASTADVVAWLALVQPGATLDAAGCGADVDLCLNVPRDPGGPGDAHVLTVQVVGEGPVAAVRVTAFTT